jgi:Flp pilus assembly protein TadB
MQATLEDDIAAAYERACLERRLDVAEQLLEVLENMARNSGDGRHVDQALAYFVRLFAQPQKPH